MGVSMGGFITILAVTLERRIKAAVSLLAGANYKVLMKQQLQTNGLSEQLSLSEKMPFVPVVNDQVGKPTYTVDLARMTPEIIRREPGIYHIANDGQCSWYEFASAFISNAVPCSSKEFPRKAKRPHFKGPSRKREGDY
jgi:dTDP-4-dehydrorhamnose reductase